MSITDELREWAKIYWTYPHENAAYVTAIADRIDILHKQAVDKAHADGERNGLQQARSASEDYRRGYEKGMADGLDVGFADALAEQGWVRLPVDADGVPIRIGDVLECREGRKGYYACLPAKVVGYHECCGEVCPIVENDGEYQVMPEMVCHDHTQTVEDVLRKFYRDFDSIHGYGPDEKEVVEKYADLLQIKEADE